MNRQARAQLICDLEYTLADSPMTITEVCQHHNLRKDTACRLYKRITGRTMSQYRMSVGNGRALVRNWINAKAKVLKKHPDAYSVKTNLPGSWMIINGETSAPMGSGPIARMAWENAYERMVGDL
jgi:hypothetical protein